MDERPDLRVVRQGMRSTLFITADGVMFRRYHDTGQWAAVRTTADECGVERCFGRRRVDEVRDDAWMEGRPAHPVPAHLWNAKAVLEESPADIQTVADRCGVRRSTAWSYMSKVVEEWPHMHVHAARLVFPLLLQCCGQSVAHGTLREAMGCLERHTDLAAHAAWKRVEEPFAHLRLARLCLQARDAPSTESSARLPSAPARSPSPRRSPPRRGS